MNKEKIERFKKDMEVFSFRQHQDVITYLIHLNAKGWTVEDAQAWVKKEIAKSDEKPEFSILIKPCPECQTSLQILSVNHSPATQTGDPSDKSVWICPKCGESIYNKESMQLILARLNP